MPEDTTEDDSNDDKTTITLDLTGEEDRDWINRGPFEDHLADLSEEEVKQNWKEAYEERGMDISRFENDSETDDSENSPRE